MATLTNPANGATHHHTYVNANVFQWSDTDPYVANGTDWRLVPVAANGQPAFAAYNRVGAEYRLHTVQVLTVSAGGISRNSVFQDEAIFASFGLSRRLRARE